MCNESEVREDPREVERVRFVASRARCLSSYILEGLYSNLLWRLEGRSGGMVLTENQDAYEEVDCEPI
jgi:hypothetical protein